jgi:hypothetical protein
MSVLLQLMIDVTGCHQSQSGADPFTDRMAEAVDQSVRLVLPLRQLSLMSGRLPVAIHGFSTLKSYSATEFDELSQRTALHRPPKM